MTYMYIGKKKQTKKHSSYKIQGAIPFYIQTPPMEEVSQNLPLRNQRSKSADTCTPSEIA